MGGWGRSGPAYRGEGRLHTLQPRPHAPAPGPPPPATCHVAHTAAPPPALCAAGVDGRRGVPPYAASPPSSCRWPRRTGPARHEAMEASRGLSRACAASWVRTAAASRGLRPGKTRLGLDTRQGRQGVPCRGKTRLLATGRPSPPPLAAARPSSGPPCPLSESSCLVSESRCGPSPRVCVEPRPAPASDLSVITVRVGTVRRAVRKVQVDSE